MKRLFFLILLLPLFCQGQTAGHEGPPLNLRPHVVAESGEDFFFNFRNDSNAEPPQAVDAAMITPLNEMSGISEDFYIRVIDPNRPVFLFNESPESLFKIEKKKEIEKERIAPPALASQSASPDKSKVGPDSTRISWQIPGGGKSQNQVAKKKPDKDNAIAEGVEKNVQTSPKGGESGQEKVNSKSSDSPLQNTKNVALADKETESPAREVVPKSDLAQSKENSSRYHALIIGVSNYKYAGPGLANLDRPVLDATKLSETLTKYYNFAPDNVHLLKDAKLSDIIESLEKIGTQITEKENLLIFYAGHGYWDENLGVGYWLPSDAIPTKKYTWIANSTIKDYIGGLKTKHTLLISDACFSGSIFKVREVEGLTDLGVSKLYQLPSRKAMTSGNMKTVPDKSKFFEYLNKRLVDNEDEYLSARQLFQNFYVAIINNTNTVPQYGVIQETGDEGGEFIFIKK